MMKKMIVLFLLCFAQISFGATRAIVPRADGEGSIGVTNNAFGEGYFKTGLFVDGHAVLTNAIGITGALTAGSNNNVLVNGEGFVRSNVLADYVTTVATSGWIVSSHASFVTATVTNGLASLTYVDNATNGLLARTETNGWVVSPHTGFVTVTVTNGLASLTYVDNATQGLVTATVTNGLASLTYVDNATNGLLSRAETSGWVVSSHATFVDQTVTNGLASIAFVNALKPLAATNADHATVADQAGYTTNANYANTAGTSVYAQVSALATLAGDASNAVRATVADVAGSATNAQQAAQAVVSTWAGSATSAVQTAQATVATWSGSSTSALTSAQATVATWAGDASNAVRATVADNAGFATNAAQAVVSTQAGYATNSGSLGGIAAASYVTNNGTVDHLYTTTASGYAGTELVSADWVRSIVAIGADFWPTTNAFTTTILPANSVYLAASTTMVNAVAFNMAVTSVNHYVMSIVDTNVIPAGETFVGPASIEIWIQSPSGAQRSLAVAPEIYLLPTQDVNAVTSPTIGDWTALPQTVTLGTTTNRLLFTIAFPNTVVTSNSYRMARLKVTTKGNNTTNLVIAFGNGFSSHVTLRSPIDDQLGTRGATNTVIGGVYGAFDGASRVATLPNVIVTNGQQITQSNAAHTNYFAGNVGIGTNAPSAKLHVQDLTAGTNELIRLTHKYTYGCGGRLSWWGDSVQQTGGILVSMEDAAVATYMGFEVANSSGTKIEPMRLTQNGLGIGTNTPATKLDVNGDATVRGSLSLSNGITQSAAGVTNTFNSNIDMTGKGVTNASFVGNGAGLTNIAAIIPPMQTGGALGYVESEFYGPTWEVAYSDTDASMRHSFMVRDAGSYKFAVVWATSAANTSKTNNSRLYISQGVTGYAPSWNVQNAASWAITIPDTSTTMTISTYGTAFTLAANTMVYSHWDKSDNCGGASGNLMVLGAFLIKQ
jgi:hypothetical protein